jgi:hypothetical protein
MDLILPLKGIYFDQIKAGVKQFEYRLANDYWKKRLLGKKYDKVVLTRGYPKRDDKERRLNRAWLGYIETRITHEHFGADSVWVYAIDVSCPHPIVTQPETNLPISGLGGYDQVLRDEFEDGKK